MRLTLIPTWVLWVMSVHFLIDALHATPGTWFWWFSAGTCVVWAALAVWQPSVSMKDFKEEEEET